jgi:protein TonB
VSYARPIEVEYPPLSRRYGETGLVVVRVLIDTAGRPAEVVVQSTSGAQRLDRAALDAVRRALFHPHTENGSPAPAYALIPVRFELQ